MGKQQYFAENRRWNTTFVESEKLSAINNATLRSKVHGGLEVPKCLRLSISRQTAIYIGDVGPSFCLASILKIVCPYNDFSLSLSFTPTTLSDVLSPVPLDDCLRFYEISVIVVVVVVVTVVVVVVLVNAEKVELRHSELLRALGATTITATVVFRTYSGRRKIQQVLLICNSAWSEERENHWWNVLLSSKENTLATKAIARTVQQLQIWGTLL